MTERWVKEVTKAIPRTAKYLPGDPSVSAIEAAKLLARQHRAVVRMVRKRSHEYMKDASDSKLSKAMQVSAASKAWAFKDFADDLAALAKQGGKK